MLSLPSLKVSQSSIDLTHRSALLGDITVDRTNASLRRESDGRLDLAKVFSAAPGPKADGDNAADAKAGKPWQVRLGSFKLTDAAFRFEDVSL